MVGRSYRVGVLEELSLGELARAVLARQGIATREEVVEDEETGMVSTIEVPDFMEEDSRGLMAIPIKEWSWMSRPSNNHYSTCFGVCTIGHVYAHNISGNG